MVGAVRAMLAGMFIVRLLFFFLLLSLIFLFFGFCLPKNDVIVVCCARMDVEELKTMLESHYQRVCTINDG